MRLLILHISDLHFDAAGENIAMFRAPFVARAALGAIPGCTNVLVIATGDFIDKGAVDGFDNAQIFFEDLAKEITEFNESISSVQVVTVPGNHDFKRPAGDDQFTWTKSIEELSKEPSAIDASAAPTSILLKNFDAYYGFQDKIGQPVGTSNAQKLFDIVHFDYDELQVRVLALNTSLVCRGEQDEGHLLASVTQDLPPSGEQLSILAMHHPFGWLRRENAKAVERKLHGFVDLILSGHEHDADDFVKHRVGQPENAYFEADTFSGPAGGFAAIVIDASTQQRKTYPFVWQGEGYACVSERQWANIRRGIGGPTDGFLIEPSFDAWLDDPGMVLPMGAAPVVLEDFYVYPRLRDVTLDLKKATSAQSKGFEDPASQSHTSAHNEKPEPPVGLTISSADVLSQLSKHSRVLVLGQARSGKTSLVRKYYKDLRGMGLVPLLLKPSDFKSVKPDDVHAALCGRIEEQYGKDSVEKFLQHPPSKKVVLIDELHSVSSDSQGVRDLFHALSALARHTIAAVDDLYVLRQVFAAVEATELLDYRMYRILELDHVQRRSLAAKLKACTSPNMDEESFSAAVHDLDTGADSVLGNQIVLPFAGEVKEIMRQLIDNPSGGSHGAYGFYYDAQIKADIKNAIGSDSKDAVQPQADALESFLSYLAFLAYKANSHCITEAQIDASIDHFYGQKVRLEKSVLLAVAQKARLLIRTPSGYLFRERYQRFYFLARYLSRLLADEDSTSRAKEILLDLVEKLHEREAADVVLFSVYLTNSTWLLRKIAEKASAIFKDKKECDMDADFEFANRSVDVAALGNHQPSYSNDDLSESGESLDETIDSTLRDMAEGFNVLNILGLAVRNYTTSIDVVLRERLIEEGYAISLRSLTAYLDLVRRGRKELALLVSKHLKLTVGSGSGEMLAARLTSVCSFGVVRRVVHAFSSPHVSLSLNDVWAERKTNSARIIRFGVQLDLKKVGSFAARQLASDLEGNGTAQVVLMYVVGSHLSTYRSSRERRLELCGAVGLNPDNPAFFYNPDRPKALGQ